MDKNIPNSGQKTVKAYMKIQSFISPSSPDTEAIEKYNNEVNVFLLTIDNNSRFLNGRNSYSVGDKICTIIWYLEKIADKPVTTPFGNKNEQPDNTETKKV